MRKYYAKKGNIAAGIFSTQQAMALSYNKIIVKIGSNVLTQENGMPDVARLEHLVGQITELKKLGKEVIVVSSGAVASGRSLITVSEKADAFAPALICTAPLA